MSHSFDPEDFSSGGGLIEGDMQFTNPRFDMYAYGGKSEPQCGLIADLIPLDESLAPIEDIEASVQFWSIGKGFTPSEDGDSITGTGGINDSSNFAHLMNSLKRNGFPSDLLKQGSAKVLEGMKATTKRVEIKRDGLSAATNIEGQPKKYQTMIVTKIHSNGVASGAGKIKAVGRPRKSVEQIEDDKSTTIKSSSAAAAGGDVEDKAQNLATAYLMQNDGAGKIDEVVGHVFRGFPKGDPSRAAAARLFGDEAWVRGSARSWTYDVKKETLTIKD